MKWWWKFQRAPRWKWVPVMVLAGVVALGAPDQTSRDTLRHVERVLSAAVRTITPAPSPTSTAKASPKLKTFISPTVLSSGSATGANPQTVAGRNLDGWQLFVDPVDSEPAAQADAWRATRPADAARMDKMAAQPQSKWMGDWFPDPYQETARYANDSAKAGKLGVLTIYNLPNRDCGLYSKGGAGDHAAYLGWLDRVVAALGQKAIIVVLEPDALAELDCYSPAPQNDVYALLSSAVTSLNRDKNALVYMDAGDAETQEVPVIASRLQRAGIANAAGFALNVSSFWPTAKTDDYGNQVSALVGGKHYVVDTSRNGNGHPGYWCNPPGRALGQSPTLHTGVTLADAYLWVKIPGESDGDCGRGEPDPGAWWPDYALGLAVAAGY